MTTVNQQEIPLPLRLMKYETEKRGINFIKHYGFRYFFPSGFSYAITTNKSWNNLLEEDWIQSVVKQHYLDEIRYITDNNFTYLLRTKSYNKTVFLKCLEELGMNNALAIYIVNNTGIASYYFTSSPNTENSTQYFLNNIEIFEELAWLTNDYINQPCNINLLEGSEYNKQLFPSYAIEVIFNKIFICGSSKKCEIFFRGEKLILTQKEALLVFYLKEGGTSKMLAQKMGLSSRGIDFHLCNLRKKTNLTSKEELVCFAKKVSGFIQLGELS